MEAVKKTVSAVKGNPLGVIGGAAAGFFLAKKFGKVEKTWQLVASAVVGGILGALALGAYKAKKGQPTAAIVKEAPKK